MKNLEQLEREKRILLEKVNEINMDIQDHYRSNDYMEMSVAGLKKSLERVPDSTPVLMQRVEDVYFDKHGWKSRELYNTSGGKSEYISIFAGSYSKENSVFTINALW